MQQSLEGHGGCFCLVVEGCDVPVTPSFLILMLSIRNTPSASVPLNEKNKRLR